MAVLAAENVSYTYQSKYQKVQALKNVSCTFEAGKFYAIIGQSGSGKTTLLSMLAGLGTPSDGEIIANGKTLKEIGSERHRRENVTVIYQSFNLFPTLNILENVMYPMQISKKPTKEAKIKAKELLNSVGLGDVDPRKLPAMLSGGQQQRVAIARALATNPKVLLCDEATSALDPKTTRQILELIGDINKKLGITVVIITHQMSVVKSVCNHVAILDDGEVVEDGLVSTVFSAPKSAAARHLVFPGGADVTVSDPTQERRIRLIFRSAKTTSIPLVARLATEENIAANVISASTQKLSEEIYGSMLLGVPAAQFDRAWKFLSGIENLQVEEASVGVQ